MIPGLFPETTARTVLSMEFIEGMPLNEWLKTGPDQAARDEIARILQKIFLRGLYELQCLHADPNPGNFIIGQDLSVGLVDFGCVKRLDPVFTDLYSQLPRVVMTNDLDGHFQLLLSMKAVREDMEAEAKDRVIGVLYQTGKWLSRLFRDEYFDFSTEGDFMAQGKALMYDFYRIRNDVDINPDILFLNRTRYGLIRVFEMLKARVRFRNPYEWGNASE